MSLRAVLLLCTSLGMCVSCQTTLGIWECVVEIDGSGTSDVVLHRLDAAKRALGRDPDVLVLDVGAASDIEWLSVCLNSMGYRGAGLTPWVKHDRDYYVLFFQPARIYSVDSPNNDHNAMLLTEAGVPFEYSSDMEVAVFVPGRLLQKAQQAIRASR